MVADTVTVLTSVRSAAVVVPVMWTDRVAPVARVVGLRTNWPPLMENAPGVVWDAIDQTLPFPRVGSGSEKVTPFAVPGPVFVTVTVNPAVAPATTLGASAVLVTVTSGERTFSVAVAGGTGGTFGTVMVAVLTSGTVSGDAVGTVVATTWTTKLEPLANETAPLFRSWRLPPLMTNVEAFGLAGSMDQLRAVPASVGSGSVSDSPVAVLVPGALEIVTVNPAWPPASTLGASAVLTTDTSGGVAR
ncbi:hypothetical protein FRUB_04978 [Fimbriiglobus ruber]|uniref:Uncharacterized protein n=1 Tax=Fimbriiglobus ruber TaxID=1908690 RepID=A0A225DU08_9BACT|nr:hypothetical protein FRUB_04978 [Fimbriiglobus ruber]